MYIANPSRYDEMPYRKCGNSGLKLPLLSFGLWHNFGSDASILNMSEMLKTAFDLGITHFDLANNYGPVPGAAEENFGRILHADFSAYRDELIISTKAGYDMWKGPYGNWGSRKYLIASLDQSLRRMGLDYVDIFYHHRMDPETPLEETMEALAQIVRSGKALYVGLSNYDSSTLAMAADILKELHVPCLIHQHRYSMLDRVNEGLIPVLSQKGIGSIAFCPLAQGLLTGKYLNGIPSDSRAAGKSIFLNADGITDDKLAKVRALSDVAVSRNQSLSQMALAWALMQGQLTSVIIGASKPGQIIENAGAINNLSFTEDEKAAIEAILNS